MDSQMLTKNTPKTLCVSCGNPEDTFFIPDTWRTPHGPGAYHLGCYLEWAEGQWLDFLSKTSGLGERTIQKYQQLLEALLHKRCGGEGAWNQDPFFPYVPSEEAAIKNRSGREYSQSSIASIIQMWESERGFMTWCTNRPGVPQSIKTYTTGAKFEDFEDDWFQYLLRTNPDKSARTVRTILSKAQASCGGMVAPFQLAPGFIPAGSDATVRSFRQAWESFYTWYYNLSQQYEIELAFKTMITSAPVADTHDFLSDIEEDPHTWTGVETPTPVSTPTPRSDQEWFDGVHATPIPELEEALTPPPLPDGAPVVLDLPRPPVERPWAKVEAPAGVDPALVDALTIRTVPDEIGQTYDEVDRTGQRKLDPPIPSPIDQEETDNLLEPPVQKQASLSTPCKVGEQSKTDLIKTYLPRFLDHQVEEGYISVSDMLCTPDLQAEVNRAQEGELDHKSNFAQRFASLLLIKLYRKAHGLE